MKTATSKWIKGLVAAVVTSFATSGLSALGIAGADAAGLNVSQLDPKQFGVIALTGGVVGLLAYLKQSPIPADE